MKNKEEFKRQLLENCIFNELKDSRFAGVNYIRTKYQGTDIDFTRLYRRIVNYQVKKYGQNLYKSNCLKTREERRKDNIKAAQRRYYKKHR